MIRTEKTDWFAELACLALGVLGGWMAIAVTVSLWCAADAALGWWLR